MKNSRDLKIKRMYEKAFSAPFIAKTLNLPLHSIYYSLKNQNVLRRTTAEQNKIRFENKPLSYKIKPNLTQHEKALKIAALMLYYGEGAKTQQTVDFANSDPAALALFLKFMLNICGVDKNRLRFYLYCFRGQNASKLIRFWSNKLNAPVDQFTKPYIRPDRTDLSRTMPFGVLHIRYSDKKLLEQILFFIKEITTQLS